MRVLALLLLAAALVVEHPHHRHRHRRGSLLAHHHNVYHHDEDREAESEAEDAESESGTPTDYLRQEIQKLSEARDDLTSRRDGNRKRFEEDENEIDRLNGEERHLEDDTAMNKEVAGVESELSVLGAEDKIYSEKKDNRSVAVESEIGNMKDIIVALKSNDTDVDTLKEGIGKEGEAFYHAANKETKQVALLEKEIKVLERKLSDAEEREDGEAGTLDSMEDIDENGSAHDLEEALGGNWKQDELEDKATQAEDALEHAFSGKTAPLARMLR